MIKIDSTFLFQIINILVLFYFLRKYLFSPVMEYLDKRNEYIRSSLTDAERKLQEASDLHERYTQEMANARREGREIIEKARLQGEELKQEIVNKGKDEYSQILTRAQDEIEREKSKAQSELQKDVATLSVLVASKILQEKVDEEIDKELVDRFIGEVGKVK
jgi:F-type H+-transporting ATPase subunit b